MGRDDAYELLTEYTKNANLIKHALAVEAAMRAYARHFGEDEQLWATVGLLHDFDYERYPDLKDHPFKGAEILRERGWPEETVEAVLAHAEHTGVARDTRLKRAIFAVDELAGFIIATALVRPDKKLASVEVKSVKKKMKDKSFAAAVKRDEITGGADELGLSLDEHIGIVLEAMQGIAEKLEL
ncbi:MAG TPA: HAD family hydrolase [Armatimonadetes bacterium]|jgi:putative nucleotidyltransferase with HDIG domain|nr:HAD family hydrolase [Armatimonadota bacterium]